MVNPSAQLAVVHQPEAQERQAEVYKREAPHRPVEMHRPEAPEQLVETHRPEAPRRRAVKEPAVNPDARRAGVRRSEAPRAPLAVSQVAA